MSRCSNSSPRLQRENHYAILAHLKISQVFIYKISITLLYFLKCRGQSILYPAAKVVIFFEMRNLFLAFLKTGAGEPKRKRSFLPWPKRTGGYFLVKPKVTCTRQKNERKRSFLLWPKRTGVKRRDRRERPERLLFERSEFQTRQRAKGTKQPGRLSLDLLVTFGSSQK